MLIAPTNPPVDIKDGYDFPFPSCIFLAMPIRMKDIAAELGLSVVTISKVLSGHPDISDQTRERVLKRVKELRYQPSATARSLVTGRSYLIGLVVPDLLHPFFAEVAKSLASVIRKRGYSLIIASSEEDPEIEEKEIHDMIARGPDGLVIASSSTSPKLFRRLDEQKQAYVLFDRNFTSLSANFVGTDDREAAYLATSHLVEMGCECIAHIRGRENSTGSKRLEGYKRALRDHGLKYVDKYVILRETVDIDSRHQGNRAMQRLLSLQPQPDGVFCYNDPMAIGAIEAALAANRRVPHDIAIIGCGNLHYSDLLQVPLSSIDQHTDLMGEHAGKLILSIVESPVRPQPHSVILKPSLVARASTDSGRRKRAAKPARI